MRRLWAIVALGVLTLGLLVGCSGQREMIECGAIVQEFERELMAQDAIFNAAYKPFQEACGRLSAHDIWATADAAIQGAAECSAKVYAINIPGNIPKELRDVLEQARKATAASYYGKGKSAENILHKITGKGEQYDKVQDPLLASQTLTMEAALSLSTAKKMVGLTQ